MQVRVVVANSCIAYRRLAAVVAVSVVLLTLLQIDLSSRDEWRRTAHGWERAGVWLVAAGAPAASIPKPSIHPLAQTRFDSHPITLAFVQLVGALLALFVVAPQSAGSQHGSLLAIISRSFRASVFGS